MRIGNSVVCHCCAGHISGSAQESFIRTPHFDFVPGFAGVSATSTVGILGLLARHLVPVPLCLDVSSSSFSLIIIVVVTDHDAAVVEEADARLEAGSECAAAAPEESKEHDRDQESTNGAAAAAARTSPDRPDHS
jgi:hypothetical protein